MLSDDNTVYKLIGPVLVKQVLVLTLLFLAAIARPWRNRPCTHPDCDEPCTLLLVRDACSDCLTLALVICANFDCVESCT